MEKIFNQITAEGAEPMPSPVKDATGNTIESKLKDNSPEEKIQVEEMPNEKQKTAKPKIVKPKKKEK